jgi:site-specific recombinase XerD
VGFSHVSARPKAYMQDRQLEVKPTLFGHRQSVGFLKTIARTGEAAKLPFPIHPHMLRHSTGYKLANDGHDTRALQYIGHKNIMHTVRYTEMAPDRFKDFWND